MLRSTEPQPASGTPTLAQGGDASGDNELVIGLVNNMPLAAVRTTDAQFRALLAKASKGWNLRIRFFVVPGFPGQPDDRFFPGRHYEDLSALWDSHLDGLIVTGAEPRAASMEDEPYWPWLARLVDWAGDHTISTIWSCLAAHAAVYRLDGLTRLSLPGKLSGVFECMKVSEHALLSDAPSRWLVPHSRQNSLDETQLREKDYVTLSRAPHVGADIFVKQVRDSLFLMLQGHPEYGSDSLMLEYRRDIRRYLAGQRDSYPEMPEGYFDQSAMTTLVALRERLCREPNLAELPLVEAAIKNVTPVNGWNSHAVRLYSGWLSYLISQKVERAAVTANNVHAAS
jgi:homoserine O-succinyltransferase